MITMYNYILESEQYYIDFYIKIQKKLFNILNEKIIVNLSDLLNQKNTITLVK